MLKVVRYKDFSSRWMFQRLSLMSSLLKHITPLRQWEISSRVGAFQCSHTMALLRSLGLRHICREPSGLWGYASKDIHSVTQETGMMTPLETMSSSVFSICSQYSMGTLLWACWMGRMLGLY